MHIALLTAAAEEEAPPNPLIPATYDILWSGVVFLIVLVVFIWKVVPRLNRALDARSAAIEGGIKKAAQAQAEAAAALDRYNDQLAEARAEAGRIREAARADGVKILNDLKAQAQSESARIIASAQATIEAERQSALVSLRSEVGTLAIDLASGVIGESLTDDARSTALVDRFLADLEASTPSTPSSSRTAAPVGTPTAGAAPTGA